MADMTWPDYVAMVEDTAVRTHLVEYRTRSDDGGPGDLVACALVDQLADGLSLVYSFFDPGCRARQPRLVRDPRPRGPGQRWRLPYLYLGYWVQRQRQDGLQGALLAPGNPAAGAAGV